MKNVIIFLSGVAVGALGTALWTMKKLVPELREEAARKAQEDIHEAPDYSQYLIDEEESEKEEKKEKVDILTPPPAETKKAKRETREASDVDYSNYSNKQEKKVEKAPTDPKPSDDEDEEEEEDVEPDAEDLGPYVIEPREFNILPGYRAYHYTLYADGTLIDDDTERIVKFNPLEKFGKTGMEELQKEGTAYIRDEANKRDYRVDMLDFNYEGPDDDDYDWGQ